MNQLLIISKVSQELEDRKVVKTNIKFLLQRNYQLKSFLINKVNIAKNKINKV